MTPSIGSTGSHGGYCGTAVRPIALNMVAEIARDPQTAGLPISGIGGVHTWHDAAEFIALGAGTVQVCTAAMVYGFRIVQDMCDGLSNFMDEQGYTSVAQMVGKAVPSITAWNQLNMNHVEKAVINQDSLHPVRALPRGLRRHLAPGDHGRRKTASAISRSRKTNAWAATCACRSARCPNTITMRKLAPGEIDQAHRQDGRRPTTPTGPRTRTIPCARRPQARCGQPMMQD